MRYPIITVRLVTNTDWFNFVNRINHRAEIAKLKRDGGKLNKIKWFKKDWIGNRNSHCQSCIPEIVKTKLFNRNPIRESFTKIFCIH